MCLHSVVYGLILATMDMHDGEMWPLTPWMAPRALYRDRGGDLVAWQVHIERELLRLAGQGRALEIRDDMDGRVALFAGPWVDALVGAS